MADFRRAKKGLEAPSFPWNQGSHGWARIQATAFPLRPEDGVREDTLLPAFSLFGIIRVLLAIRGSTVGNSLAPESREPEAPTAWVGASGSVERLRAVLQAYCGVMSSAA